METLQPIGGINEALTGIIEQENGETTRSLLAKQALESKAPAVFFENVLQNGCICKIASDLMESGVGHLTYRDFFEDIDVIRQYIAALELPLDGQDEIDGWLTWVDFEAAAYWMSRELGLNVYATQTENKPTEELH